MASPQFAAQLSSVGCRLWSSGKMSLGVGFTYDRVRELCQKVTEEIHNSERSSLTNLDFRSEGFIPHFQAC